MYYDNTLCIAIAVCIYSIISGILALIGIIKVMKQKENQCFINENILPAYRASGTWQIMNSSDEYIFDYRYSYHAN